ncbi:TPA: hypothetical protein QDE50_37170, partial [Burkholderia cenocepacia]|nr:hypothetical protein [Burkholderia cenocepacia]
ATRRVAATDATQCTGYRTDHTTETAGRIADATQGTRHRTHCTACRVTHCFPGRGRSACDDHAVGFADTSQRGSQHPRLGRRGGQAEQSRDRQGDACQFHVRFRFHE